MTEISLIVTLNNQFTSPHLFLHLPAWQRFPVNPGEHRHEYPLTPSMHVALFMQELGKQSLISVKVGSDINNYDKRQIVSKKNRKRT